MGDWSLTGQSHSVGASWLLTLTAHASAHTKGAWTQLSSALPFDAYLTFHCSDASLDYDYLFDIGIGAAGSEIVLVSNMLWCTSTIYTLASGIWTVPIIIPKGTRVAARCQCSTAGSKVAIVNYQAIYTGGFGHEGLCNFSDTYGANTADSGGTSIDPGGTAYSWGAWTQLTAATTRNIKGLICAVGTQLDLARTTAYWFASIGVGGAGFESSLITFTFNLRTTYNLMLPSPTVFFPVSIPAGTRLSARGLCNINDANRYFDIIAYAFS
jgi:hypothetical protein